MHSMTGNLLRIVGLSGQTYNHDISGEERVDQVLSRLANPEGVGKMNPGDHD